MISWLATLMLLGLGVYMLRVAIQAAANLTLTCARKDGVTSCELRWTYPLGIVQKLEFPNLRSVSVQSQQLHPYRGSAHFLVLNPDEPSWPFGPWSTAMTQGAAWGAASKLEKFLRDPAREALVIELSERSLLAALMFLLLAAAGCGPFVFSIWLLIRS